MENNKLIALTEFVNRIDELVPAKDYEMDYDTNSSQLNAIKRYAKFLSQPLTLSMFVPCGINGNIVEESMCNEGSMATAFYNECKSNVLFEGFKLSGDMIIMPDFDCADVETFIGSIVEDMTAENIIGMKLALTPTALKQIYG